MIGLVSLFKNPGWILTGLKYAKVYGPPAFKIAKQAYALYKDDPDKRDKFIKKQLRKFDKAWEAGDEKAINDLLNPRD